jgi:hypothetical protein
MLGPSRKQSTGQTSTQSVNLQRMQDSVTTWVMTAIPERRSVVDQANRPGQRAQAGETDPIDDDFTVRYLQRQTNEVVAS